MRLIARARLISRVILRCSFAETPVMRRGRMRPVSVVNFESRSESLKETLAGVKSRRRRGIFRLERRKLARRSLFLGSMIFQKLIGGGLATLPMESPTLEEEIELHLLQTTRRVEALLVARRHVLRGLLALSACFCALQYNNVSSHSGLETRSKPPSCN